MISLTLPVKTARSASMLPLLAGGKLTIYDGEKPTPGAAITDQVALLEYDLETPAGTVVDDTLTFDIPIPSAGLATSTASWGRMTSSTDVVLIDGDCGVFGSGALFVLDSLSIATGVVITILSIVFTEA